MVYKKLSSEGLNSLLSQERLDLLDAIDTLRSQGISQHVSLPQIIVCGDQSSGKSSVLEAISGVPFPVSSSLCTRFPTEFILRKASQVSIQVSIVPHHSRNRAERDALSGFHEDLEGFEDLPALVENAKTAMGIVKHGNAFSKDLLRIEIEGPDRPQLTIVDLPGLIHSENKQQSASDIDLITDVVKRYMQQPRSIILAVVSAKNDYANQVVLKLARRADKKGSRTLGIITKPDTLSAGSKSERTFVSLAKNQDIEFRLGWHVLRNTDTDTEVRTLAERDEVELDFFSGSQAWSSLPPTSVGIKTLRTRLSELLLRQIASELPALMEEIALKSANCQRQLDQLGEPRISPHEQRVYLTKVSQSFQSLVQAATDGTYDHPFFGNADSAVGFQKRFRAVVQVLSRTFAATLREFGQRYPFSASPETDTSLAAREAFITKVVRMIEQTRGRELPGMFNPMIISDLFKEQSTPWRKIAETHMTRLWKAAQVFLNHAVRYISDTTTAGVVLEKVVRPALDLTKKRLDAKMEEIIKPHQTGHPITYNHSFLRELQDIRLKRRKRRYEEILKTQSGTSFSFDKRATFTMGDLRESLVDMEERDINKQAASDAVDCLEAYYTVALERFTDDVAVEAVEMCLIAQLRDILNPLAVSQMPEDQVTSIAGEQDASRTLRKGLQEKLSVLQGGSDICSRFSGRFVQYTATTTSAEDDEALESGSESNSEAAASKECSSLTPPSTDPVMDAEPVEMSTATMCDELASVPETKEEESADNFSFWAPSSKKGKKKKKNRKSMLEEPEPVSPDDEGRGW